MATKILLDTDIGSDIDDAICLAYLLAQPECELLGITTVTGEVEKRAMLASVLCKVAGKDIPIFPGAAQPLFTPIKQAQAPQATSLARWEHQTSFPRGEAIEFLRQTIRKHPGEITLLTIGPLTNIALLFAVDPEIPALLKGLVMMCGIFFIWGPGACEWNALNDPYATALVYRTTVKTHRSIGLDVTSKVQMSAEHFRKRCMPMPLLQPVVDFAGEWFKHQSNVTFHDPLAAATLFDERICRFTPGYVEVEHVSPMLEGLTRWNKASKYPKHEIATEVDSERFFTHYFSVFSR